MVASLINWAIDRFFNWLFADEFNNDPGGSDNL